MISRAAGNVLSFYSFYRWKILLYFGRQSNAFFRDHSGHLSCSAGRETVVKEHVTTLNKPRTLLLRWHLYILKCSDNTFYTGVTNNLERRLGMHNDGRASRYTRSRLPVILIYQERCRNKSSALKKECRIKSLSRKEKEEYVHKKSKAPDPGSSPE
jgi:putative endonuclease